MQDFVSFCRGYGVILDGLPPVGRWVRAKTEDKPRHRNGAVKWLGDVGFVQNWANMDEPAVWRGETTKDVIQRIRRDSRAAEEQAHRRAQQAARKAAQMLSECVLDEHDYFERKGFPEHKANIWTDGDILIPMRRGREIVGCQRINAAGEKSSSTDRGRAALNSSWASAASIFCAKATPRRYQPRWCCAT